MMTESETPGPSGWQKIHQRKLVQWAVAYLAGAWLVLQFVELLAGVYGWQPLVMRLVTGGLAIGLPVVLVLGWYHGDRGEQRVSRMELSILTLLLLIGGAVLWSMERGERPDATSAAGPDAASRATAPAASAIPQRSIAVLPFVNMSADPANEYFSDGLAETLLDMLAQVPDLMVAARTSSFAFKGKALDIRSIGATLGVAHMLEGSVQKSGDQVRITAQLIKASDGSHLWSKRFDRKLDDVFRIQDEIATEVVAALQIALGGREQQHLTQRRTDNFEAYEAYLKGVALLPRRKVAELQQAAAHFERAITLDPAFAKAYVGARDAYDLLREYGSVTAEQRARIPRYTARALELAPDLGEAHASLGNSLKDAGDFAGAEREFRRAIELAPSYATAHQWYGLILLQQGRFDEALERLRKATALDPLAPVIALNLAGALDGSGRLDEAEAELARLATKHPEYPQTYWYQAIFASNAGDMVGALTKLRLHQARDPDAIRYGLQRCYAMLDFAALPEAQDCVDGFARRAPADESVVDAQIELALLRAGPIAAGALLDRTPAATSEFRAGQLLRLGRTGEALAMYREQVPDLLAEPTPAVLLPRVVTAMELGATLLRSGSSAQGRALIKGAMDAMNRKHRSMYAAGLRWHEALGHTLLGDREQAYAALERAIARGEFVGVTWLDHDPLFAPLRADPRYEKTIAPARARAAAQVELARKAGLL